MEPNYGDLGALLIKLGYSYDSDEGRAVAANGFCMTGMVYATADWPHVWCLPDYHIEP